MVPWYRRERFTIALMALATGLLLGGLAVLILGRPHLKDDQEERSAVAAIASDQTVEHPRDSAAEAKPADKPKPAAKPTRARAEDKGGEPAPATAASPDAADRADEKNAERGADSPRRQTAARRV